MNKRISWWSALVFALALSGLAQAEPSRLTLAGRPIPNMPVFPAQEALGQANVAAASWGEGRLDVVAGGRDGAVYHNYFEPSSGWHGWVSIGGSDRTSAPSVASWGPGRLDVFAKGPNGTLMHNWFENGAWRFGSNSNAWENLGGQITGTPAVVSWGKDRLDVFALRGSENIDHLWFENGWRPWETTDHGHFASDVTAVSWGFGRLDLFAQTESHTLYHRFFDYAWQMKGEDLGGQVYSRPAATSVSSGQLDVWTHNGEGLLVNREFDKAWKGWTEAGTSPAATLTAVHSGQGEIHFLYQEGGSLLEAPIAR
jgi:hypothetical protein